MTTLLWMTRRQAYVNVSQLQPEEEEEEEEPMNMKFCKFGVWRKWGWWWWWWWLFVVCRREWCVNLWGAQGSSHTTDHGSFQELLAGCKEFLLRFWLLLQWLVENCSNTTKSTLPLVGWCRRREKIDWQEAQKFDCWLVRTIFIFCCPSSIFTRHLRVARKSNFDF